eukprot:9921-Pelagomonas_calceolata.AAC.1
MGHLCTHWPWILSKDLASRSQHALLKPFKLGCHPWPVANVSFQIRDLATFPSHWETPSMQPFVGCIKTRYCLLASGAQPSSLADQVVPSVGVSADSFGIQKLAFSFSKRVGGDGSREVFSD